MPEFVGVRYLLQYPFEDQKHKELWTFIYKEVIKLWATR